MWFDMAAKPINGRDSSTPWYEADATCYFRLSDIASSKAKAADVAVAAPAQEAKCSLLVTSKGPSKVTRRP